MKLTTLSALHYSSEQLSCFLGACFEGYSVPVSLTAERFALRFGAEDISLTDSCVWWEGETLVAIAIITQRSDTARLAAYAVRPAYRGKGISKRLLAPLFERLRQKGIRQLRLEVIADNLAGIGLYRSLGFEQQRVLRGYQGATSSASGENVLRDVNPLELILRAAKEVKNTLPWQLDPLSLLTLPCQVYEYRKHAYAAISMLMDAPSLRFIYVEPEYRGNGVAREMLTVLHHRFAGLSTPVAVPESFTPLFVSAGYCLMDIRQLEMRAML
ncbi:GNAT family N-acetyltransferase [Yokenella regensburgei]|uniref:GNAT family N-acetyltransferase n=1 Tax=Yokenella regensburgei TaxID=158877 RepID=UPI003F16B539